MSGDYIWSHQNEFEARIEPMKGLRLYHRQQWSLKIVVHMAYAKRIFPGKKVARSNAMMHIQLSPEITLWVIFIVARSSKFHTHD